MHIQIFDEQPLELTSHDQGNDSILKRVLFSHARDLDHLITGKLAMVNYAELKAGGFVSKHKHGNKKLGMTEIFYILSGESLMEVDKKEFKVQPGMLIIVEPYEVHSMKNISKYTCTYLAIGISNGGSTTVISEE